MVILALEASTSSAKALLYDHTLISELNISYDEQVGDIKQQNPSQIMALVFECGKKLLSAYDGRVDCIALSSVWSSLLLLDQDKKPATMISTWADISGNEIIKAYRKDAALWDYAYRHTGCNIHSKYPAWRLAALKDQGIFKKEHHISSLAEWMFYSFTGKHVVSDIMASGTGLYNLETLTWDHHLMQKLDIDDHQLSKIVSYKSGYNLSEEAKESLGIDYTVPVFIPNGDGGLNHISEMEEKEQVISLSIGTSAAIRVDVKGWVTSKDRSIWSHYLGDYGYISGGTISGAGSLVNWFLEKINNKYTLEELEAKLTSVNIEQAPIFLPFLLGEQSVGWKMASYGGFYDTDLKIDTANEEELVSMYYSLLEGISFNLKQCYDALDIEVQDLSSRMIRISGGVTKSPFWLQMLADIFGQPLHRSTIQHQSIMGSIKIALDSLAERYVDEGVPSEKIKNITGSSRVNLAIAPQENRNIYSKRYEKYLKYYINAFL